MCNVLCVSSGLWTCGHNDHFHLTVDPGSDSRIGPPVELQQLDSNLTAHRHNCRIHSEVLSSRPYKKLHRSPTHIIFHFVLVSDQDLLRVALTSDKFCYCNHVESRLLTSPSWFERSVWQPCAIQQQLSIEMSSSNSLSTMIANGGPFIVSMEHENLCIISIPTESVPTFAWWLFREYCLDRRKKNCFHSVLMVRQSHLQHFLSLLRFLA